MSSTPKSTKPTAMLVLPAAVRVGLLAALAQAHANQADANARLVDDDLKKIGTDTGRPAADASTTKGQ